LRKNSQLAIIPAFNESKNIARTISKIPLCVDIVVIDDGSTDNTRSQCKGPNVALLYHVRNLGYEAALNSGITYFVEQEYDKFVVIDADGEIEPADAIALLNSVSEQKPIGCGYRVDHRGRLSERLISTFSKNLFGINDVYCGCKAFHKVVVNPKNYSSVAANFFTQFIILQSKKINVINKPVHGRKRHEASSFGNGMRVELSLVKKFIGSCVAYLFNQK